MLTVQVTCKLPKSMLPVVVGEDGKIVAEIAKDSDTKITLLTSTPQEETVLFHIVGTPGRKTIFLHLINNILISRALQDRSIHDADQDQGENDHPPQQTQIQSMIAM